MSNILAPPRHPKKILRLPGSPRRRLLRRPDLRPLVRPYHHASPLMSFETDHDDLDIVQSWREFETDRPDAVRYFMMRIRQRNPGQHQWWEGYKAVRFVRLTRVPRWLRQQSAGIGRPGASQMAYVLAALREQGCLFVQLVAKTPADPLIFAYGVQSVAATPQLAQAAADESHASLCALLDGTFQQIEHSHITVAEAERISLQQHTWDNIAVARGRPMLNTGHVGAAGVLDGNRTDMENTHNQLEAFIRGMSESRKGFMLSMVTSPISVADMNIAVANVARHLSVVRSETRGSRSFHAGAALPLMVGASDGLGETESTGSSQSESESSSYGSSSSFGESQSAATSESETYSGSRTETHGTSEAQGVSESQSSSRTETHGTSQSETHGTSQSRTVTEGSSSTVTEGSSSSDTQGTSRTVTEGDARTEGVSSSATQGTSRTETDSVSQSSSLTQSTETSQGTSEGSSWSSSTGRSEGTSASTGTSSGWGSSASLVGLIGGSESGMESASTGASSTVSSQSGAGGSESSSQSQSQGTSRGETSTTGRSASEGSSQSRTEGQSSSQTQSRSSSQGTSQSATEGTSRSAAAGTSRAVAAAAGSSHAATAGSSHSVAQTQGVTQGTSQTDGSSHSVGRTAGASRTAGETHAAAETRQQGMSESDSSSRAVTDAYAVALSRQAGHMGSMGVVPHFGAAVSRETFDASKSLMGDVLEETMRRYVDGLEGGGWLYQMILQAEDRETLLAGSSLLKASFWGPGDKDRRLAQPFHVVVDPAEAGMVDSSDSAAEKDRLLVHARAYSTYRKREANLDIVEPFAYSSYVSCGELSAFARPPVAESVGLLAVHDSAPVMAMPGDRGSREIGLGQIFNGERAKISQASFGIDTAELTHTLISGVTGSGKTTTLMRLLSELCRVTKPVVMQDSPSSPPRSVEVGASVLAMDWARSMRHLGSLVDPVRVDPDTGKVTGRFRFFSVQEPHLGAFNWNPLAVPSDDMHPGDWLGVVADNMVASWNLGEFGRSLIQEYLDRLYSANRLEPFELVPAVEDDDGNVVRDAMTLPAVPEEDLPDGAVATDPSGQRVANVYSCAELSRLVGVQHLAQIVLAEVESAGTLDGGRLRGTSARDRLQSLWRRVSYFAPGGPLSGIIGCDSSLRSREFLSVRDLVSPDRGQVTVLETEGLDLANRRFILGSVLTAVYRAGLHAGEGAYDHGGSSPGLHLVLEEAHELFGESQGADDDKFSSDTRTALYASMHRRSRALGIKLIDVVQNPADIPAAVTSNTSTVFAHRTYEDADRRKMFALLNWNNQIGQQQREWRFLGELPVGHAIVRLHAVSNFLESAPVHLVTSPAVLGRVTDDQLEAWASLR